MRVLQLHTRYRIPAGEDAVVEAEARALRAAGHDVEQLIVPNPTTTLSSVVALARSLHNAQAADRVTRTIGEFAPDVVHVHNTWFASSSSVILAAATAGCPVVMTLHNFRLACLSSDFYRDGGVCTSCLGRTPLPGVRHGCYRSSRALSALAATEVTLTRRRRVLDRSVTTFVAPSTFMADRLLDVGIPADRVVVKSHFVDDPGARPAPPSASNDVVVVGRVAPGKGIETLLAAWNRRADRRRRLVVVGDGPLRDELSSDAASDVDWRGWLEPHDVRELLGTARALVMPSELYETFGMVLIEALAAGLPVIVTTAAGAADIVDPPEPLLVPPRSVSRLTAAIDALDDDDLVDEVGERGRTRFVDRFSETTGVTALERVYEQAIAGVR